MPHARDTDQPAVTIDAETETQRGWCYSVRFGAGRDGETPAQSRTHEITLAWVDHDHWSGGSIAPCAVVLAACQLIARRIEAGASEPDAARLPRSLPVRFDLSTARRWIADFDSELRAALASCQPTTH